MDRDLCLSDYWMDPSWTRGGRSGGGASAKSRSDVNSFFCLVQWINGDHGQPTSGGTSNRMDVCSGRGSGGRGNRCLEPLLSELMNSCSDSEENGELKPKVAPEVAVVSEKTKLHLQPQDEVEPSGTEDEEVDVVSLASAAAAAAAAKPDGGGDASGDFRNKSNAHAAHKSPRQQHRITRKASSSGDGGVKLTQPANLRSSPTTDDAKKRPATDAKKRTTRRRPKTSSMCRCCWH